MGQGDRKLEFNLLDLPCDNASYFFKVNIKLSFVKIIFKIKLLTLLALYLRTVP